MIISNRARSKQRGVVLFIALIVLVAMTLAGIALVRSTDTGNVVAGNTAFKQSSLQATDIGVEKAFADLPSILGSALEKHYPDGCTTNCRYYATMRELDSTGSVTAKEQGASGAATVIDWANAFAVTLPNGFPSGYDVRYVVDRLCSGALPITDIQKFCVADKANDNCSLRPGVPCVSSADSVYYRATVRVTGPNNSISLAQAIFSQNK